MVAYITCIVIYLVPQSEYRICSPCDIVLSPSTLFPFRIQLASVPPRAGLVNAGFASGSETARKPHVLFLLLVPPGQKHNIYWQGKVRENGARLGFITALVEF
jgi:hypothetical protein